MENRGARHSNYRWWNTVLCFGYNGHERCVERALAQIRGGGCRPRVHTAHALVAASFRRSCNCLRDVACSDAWQTKPQNRLFNRCFAAGSVGPMALANLGQISGLVSPDVVRDHHPISPFGRTTSQKLSFLPRLPIKSLSGYFGDSAPNPGRLLPCRARTAIGVVGALSPKSTGIATSRSATADLCAIAPETCGTSSRPVELVGMQLQRIEKRAHLCGHEPLGGQHGVNAQRRADIVDQHAAQPP